MRNAEPSLVATLSLALCFSGAAAAEPLYLGEEEYNTDDRAVMIAIVEHCAGLQAEVEAAEIAGSSQGNEDSSKETGAGQAKPFAESAAITVDRLASGDGKGAMPDPSHVAARDCAAAGITY
ncbi:hypothetical protein J3456_01845 [Sulfitobacter sp. NFXS29]|uniref:hypothetical protein n=1 Tax=Sulfitobacter sp. NFXS29 TaxID=2818438 RepID=UPI0032DF21D2